jgi:hypothetical protein
MFAIAVIDRQCVIFSELIKQLWLVSQFAPATSLRPLSICFGGLEGVSFVGFEGLRESLGGDCELLLEAGFGVSHEVVGEEVEIDAKEAVQLEFHFAALLDVVVDLQHGVVGS